jgi:hypothetical protein
MAELALKETRKALAARISDPRTRIIPGMVDDLRAILGGFEDLERRVGTLATIVLRKHYRPDQPMHEALWKSLSDMSDSAGVEYRIGLHGDRCTCVECMAQQKGAYR